MNFTQYLLPDGRKKPMEIFMPDEVEEIASQLTQKGYEFEAEILTTGEVSLECVYGEGESAAIEIVPNGPDVISAVEKLVRDALQYDLAHQ